MSSLLNGLSLAVHAGEGGGFPYSNTLGARAFSSET